MKASQAGSARDPWRGAEARARPSSRRESGVGRGQLGQLGQLGSSLVSSRLVARSGRWVADGGPRLGLVRSSGSPLSPVLWF